VTEEALEGIVACHSDLLAKTENQRVVKYVGSPAKGRVGILTGGGSGHERAFVGQVGKNMVDVVAVGETFCFSVGAHLSGCDSRGRRRRGGGCAQRQLCRG
jgi:dihydroxyacetone kinase